MGRQKVRIESTEKLVAGVTRRPPQDLPQKWTGSTRMQRLVQQAVGNRCDTPHHL